MHHCIIAQLPRSRPYLYVSPVIPAHSRFSPVHPPEQPPPLPFSSPIPRSSLALHVLPYPSPSRASFRSHEHRSLAARHRRAGRPRRLCARARAGPSRGRAGGHRCRRRRRRLGAPVAITPWLRAQQPAAPLPHGFVDLLSLSSASASPTSPISPSPSSPRVAPVRTEESYAHAPLISFSHCSSSPSLPVQAPRLSRSTRAWTF